jgi:hypothetical protein
LPLSIAQARILTQHPPTRTTHTTLALKPHHEADAPALPSHTLSQHTLSSLPLEAVFDSFLPPSS